MSFLMVGDEMI